jgi:hypothetical protein
MSILLAGAFGEGKSGIVVFRRNPAKRAKKKSRRFLAGLEIDWIVDLLTSDDGEAAVLQPDRGPAEASKPVLESWSAVRRFRCW